MAYFDHHQRNHHADLFKRDLAHPNWTKVAVVAGTLAFWIAVIEVLRALF